MSTFLSEPIRTKLLADPTNPLHFFRKRLAAELPSPTMAGVALAIKARTLLLDRDEYPPAVYMVIRDALPGIAREVLPEGEGEDIARHLEAT